MKHRDGRQELRQSSVSRKKKKNCIFVVGSGQDQGWIRNAKQVITVNISIPGRRELSWSDHKNKLVAINQQLELRSDILFRRTDFSSRACLVLTWCSSTVPEPGLTVTEIQIVERPDLVSDKVFVCSIVGRLVICHQHHHNTTSPYSRAELRYQPDPLLALAAQHTSRNIQC